MTTKEELLQYVRSEKERRGNRPGDDPIYRLFLFEKPDSELIYHIGEKDRPSGFPDTGSSSEPGFYYDLDHAIEAMNENACDIRETCYKAGFILCQFQGLYNPCCTEQRMYFLWDDTKQGYYQTEEPAIFAHIAY